MSYLDELPGRYHLERMVDDYGNEKTTAMIGTCVIKDLGDGQLAYREDVKIEGERMAFREFTYKLDGSKLHVEFADSHRDGEYVCLDFSENPVATADHLCGDDVYAHEMAFLSANNWSTRVGVRGPEKHMVIRTTYYRATDDEQSDDAQTS